MPKSSAPSFGALMIHRSTHDADRLDVAGLNEITELVDRSETELTEVAINTWHTGVDSPPHAHPRKEQNFLVTSGRGTVQIGDEAFPAEPGSFFFIPAGVVHQSITEGSEPLAYFLFNAFLGSDKEGHASFADHIAKVKETRRRQAEEKRAEIDPEVAVSNPPVRKGLRVDIGSLAAGSTVILGRDAAERSEAIHHRLAAGATLEVPKDPTKETTYFIFSGSGEFSEPAETVNTKAGEVVFVPRGTSLTIKAGPDGIQVVSFGTVIDR